VADSFWVGCLYSALPDAQKNNQRIVNVRFYLKLIELLGFSKQPALDWAGCFS